jgi:uncharacterized protein (DUF983 family)
LQNAGLSAAEGGGVIISVALSAPGNWRCGGWLVVLVLVAVAVALAVVLLPCVRG